MKLTPEVKRLCGMVADGLLEPEDYQHLLRPARRKRKRKPSLAGAIRQVRRAGIDRGSVTVGDVTVTFGESETLQGNALDEWIAKHAH
jgi:hypothetical protein